MVVEQYISELLYRYNCVVVPNFGAFLTQKMPATYNEVNHTFSPPTKLVTFNGQLTTNDGLLVSYIADSTQQSYETVLPKLTKVVEDWKNTLEREDKLSLVDLGLLWKGAESKWQFQPYQSTNYLSSSFGLASTRSIPITREVLKEEVEILEEQVPFIISVDQRERSTFRPLLKYAAIFLLALATGLTGFRWFDQGVLKQQVVHQEVQGQVTKQLQEATFFDTSPIELPTVTVDAIVHNINSAKEAGKHHIIAGAFRIKENADKKISSLKQKGFDAAYYGKNKYGLHMVSYDRFNDSKQALQRLREIKNTESKDAWLLSDK